MNLLRLVIGTWCVGAATGLALGGAGTNSLARNVGLSLIPASVGFFLLRGFLRRH